MIQTSYNLININRDGVIPEFAAAFLLIVFAELDMMVNRSAIAV